MEAGRTMTTAQLNLYRRLAGQARKVWRARGIPASECEAERHALHARALGANKSSLDFTNGDFDKVKGALLAVIDGSDLGAQIDALNQPKKRRLWSIRDLLAKMQKPEAYAMAIARQMHGGALSSAASLDDLGEEALEAVIVSLKGEKRRAKVRAAVPVAVETEDDAARGSGVRGKATGAAGPAFSSIGVLVV